MSHRVIVSIAETNGSNFTVTGCYGNGAKVETVLEWPDFVGWGWIQFSTVHTFSAVQFNLNYWGSIAHSSFHSYPIRSKGLITLLTYVCCSLRQWWLMLNMNSFRFLRLHLNLVTKPSLADGFNSSNNTKHNRNNSNLIILWNNNFKNSMQTRFIVMFLFIFLFSR